LLTLCLCAGLAAPVSAQSGGEDAEARLQQQIETAIHADGPFFTPDEHALIERHCGYAAGTWDGRNVNMSDGILTCSNGRRVDHPEVRAMMEVAGERIARRVNAAVNSAEFHAAIAAIASEATAEALRELRQQGVIRSRRDR
jgi:hypothetical protein